MKELGLLPNSEIQIILFCEFIFPIYVSAFPLELETETAPE